VFSRLCLAHNLAMVVVGFPATSVLLVRARVCISASHSIQDLDYALEVCVFVKCVCEMCVCVGRGSASLVPPEPSTLARPDPGPSTLLLPPASQVISHVADQCLLKYRKPAEAAKQVDQLVASAPKAIQDSLKANKLLLG
jgi:hypothetical protein